MFTKIKLVLEIFFDIFRANRLMVIFYVSSRIISFSFVLLYPLTAVHFSNSFASRPDYILALTLGAAALTYALYDFYAQNLAALIRKCLFRYTGEKFLEIARVVMKHGSSVNRDEYSELLSNFRAISTSIQHVFNGTIDNLFIAILRVLVSFFVLVSLVGFFNSTLLVIVALSSLHYPNQFSKLFTDSLSRAFRALIEYSNSLNSFYTNSSAIKSLRLTDFELSALTEKYFDVENDFYRSQIGLIKFSLLKLIFVSISIFITILLVSNSNALVDFSIIDYLLVGYYVYSVISPVDGFIYFIQDSTSSHVLNCQLYRNIGVSRDSYSESSCENGFFSISIHRSDNLFSHIERDDFYESGVVWVKGANGAGKSTFFKAISGCYLFDRLDVSVKHGFSKGYFFDSIVLPQNIVFEQRRIFDVFEGDLLLFNRALSLFKGFGEHCIEPDFRLDQLSGGQLKKVFLVRIFLASHSVLILDEPFNDLDSDSSKFLANLINEVSRSKLIFISHHGSVLPSGIDQSIMIDI